MPEKTNNFATEYCQKPVRVLQVFGRVGLGGAESRIMDLYRNIDRSKVQFDFLVHHSARATGKKMPTSEELMAVREQEYFDEEIKSLGGNIYVIPRFEGFNILSYKKAVDNFFKLHQNEWVFVQGHITSTCAIYLPIAKKYGAKAVASHVRSAGTDPGIKGLATKFLRIPLRKKGTVDYSIACSREAGIAVYGQQMMNEGNVKVIPNAINVERYSYNEEVRNKIRNDLDIQDAFVIGHVGRFHYAKNHEFMIKVFKTLLDKLSGVERGRYRLMLLGEGELMDASKAQVKELGIEENVMFMNNKSNIYDYYQVMDYFLFPSRYEGLPGTVVEAQAAGLKCLISDTITRDVDVTDLVERMSIEELPEKWADRIYEDIIHPGDIASDRKKSSTKLLNQIKEAGFDSKAQAKMMTNLYLKGRFDK
ncbi:MAG: glycosyltransferase family 1 protein [Butyrivibrio sp.]|nr:glycosyltransferase family 1 protein [Butyrivibrio sp.]